MELSNKIGGMKLKKILSLMLLSIVLILAACGGGDAGNDITADDLIQAFKDAGLEVGDVVEMDKKEFGNVRKEGKRVLVPSLGEDAGGRLMSFNKKKDLEETKSYYDDLGKSGPMFFSHTHQSGLFLLQMNGDMEDEEFEKYVVVMDETIK